jgi:hypothetical protein
LILNSICAMSWSASPIIRSTVSTNSYPGTWPQSFQCISQHLKCPLKNRWTLEPHPQTGPIIKTVLKRRLRNGRRR